MDISKLADAHRKAVADLDKRLAAKPTASLVSKMGRESVEAQVGRINARIAGLEEQKKRTVARLDEAIDRERKALDAISKEKPDIDYDKLLAKKSSGDAVLKQTGAKTATDGKSAAKGSTGRSKSASRATVRKPTAKRSSPAQSGDKG